MLVLVLDVCFKCASDRLSGGLSVVQSQGGQENRADGEVAALCENKQRALSPGEAMSKLI